MLQDAVIASLVAAVGELGLDGVNVDIEALDPLLVAAYNGLRQRGCGRRSSPPIPTTRCRSRRRRTRSARRWRPAANQAGADRIFMMAYDYRTGASDPGATSPLDRRDGDDKDLPWSLDLYAAVGVPPEKLLLGLPLYGVTWPVVGPEIGAPATGRGESWILRNHLDLLRDEDAVPQRDEIESVEVYALGSDGSDRAAPDGRRPRPRRWPRLGPAGSPGSASASSASAAPAIAATPATASPRASPRRRLAATDPTPAGRGRRSTSTRPRRSGPRWTSPTSAASPAPGSGRSATSAACPATPT